MRRWLIRRHSGQSMVEFAVLAPVFFLLLLGTIDLGRGIYIYNSISDAAREGTRCAVHSRLDDVVDGRKLRFQVEVVAQDGRTIGVGTHERRVIDGR